MKVFINNVLLYHNPSMLAFKIFHPAELEEATNHFDTCLGKGGFGAVYYGKRLKHLSAFSFLLLYILKK